MKCLDPITISYALRLPPRGGSGLKSIGATRMCLADGSPSARREWIEISATGIFPPARASPSARREWIEIRGSVRPAAAQPSPSARREWIEIRRPPEWWPPARWSPSARREWIEISLALVTSGAGSCLPPRGGSGLKFYGAEAVERRAGSPSARREWIEMPSGRKISAPATVSLREEGVD